MKRNLTILFQVIIVLLAISAFVFLLWEPTIEGRNLHATLLEIYFNDPFLAFVYVASITVFVALYKAFKILWYVRQNKTFSQMTIKALRTIKYCAISIIVFVILAEAYFVIVQSNQGEDIAGGVVMGIFVAFASLIIVITTAVWEKFIKNRL